MEGDAVCCGAMRLPTTPRDMTIAVPTAVLAWTTLAGTVREMRGAEATLTWPEPMLWASVVAAMASTACFLDRRARWPTFWSCVALMLAIYLDQLSADLRYALEYLPSELVGLAADAIWLAAAWRLLRIPATAEIPEGIPASLAEPAGISAVEVAAAPVGVVAYASPPPEPGEFKVLRKFFVPWAICNAAAYALSAVLPTAFAKLFPAKATALGTGSAMWVGAAACYAALSVAALMAGVVLRRGMHVALSLVFAGALAHATMWFVQCVVDRDFSGPSFFIPQVFATPIFAWLTYRAGTRGGTAR